MYDLLRRGAAMVLLYFSEGYSQLLRQCYAGTLCEDFSAVRADSNHVFKVCGPRAVCCYGCPDVIQYFDSESP